jgi:hypothetical protein
MSPLPRFLASLPILALLLAPACSKSGGDADPDAGDLPDAGAALPDSAPLPDAEVEDPCDYTEANDEGNAATPEETGLTFSGAPLTICGRIDPAQASEGIADVDLFNIDVMGEDPVPFRLELTSAAGETLEGFLVLLFDEGAGQPFNGALFEDGYGVIFAETFIPGTTTILVGAEDEPLPAGPIDYKIRLGEVPECLEATAAPDYTEASEAPDHRNNDVITVAFGATETTIGLTENGDDAPELTGVTLAGGTTVSLAGNSANVDPDGDDYRDRDTFQVATGTATEMDVRLSWTGADVDMDLLLFAENVVSEDDELARFGGTFIGTEDEIVTLRVTPGTNLWIWAAAFDDDPTPTELPTDYRITICPRTVVP